MCQCVSDSFLFSKLMHHVARQPSAVKVILFLVLCFNLNYISGHPARIKRDTVLDDNVQSYLMKYGYMGGDGALALRTQESVSSALSDMQQFAGLPATGRLDQATLQLLNKPRCGLPDKNINQTPGRRKKRFTLKGEKWPYTNLTWSLRRNLRHLDSYEVRNLIAKAFDVWSKHTRLVFSEVDNDRADILIYFYSGSHGDNFPFDGKGKTLAHAFFPNGGRSTDVHFDADEIWTTRADPVTDGTNFFNVAAHEFGHSLGLAHSQEKGALMFPWYQEIGNNGDNYELPSDDKVAIQYLYGTREDEKWGIINKNYPTTSTTSTTVRLPERPHYPNYYPNYPTEHRPHHIPYPTKRPDRPYTRKPMNPKHKHQHKHDKCSFDRDAKYPCHPVYGRENRPPVVDNPRSDRYPHFTPPDRHPHSHHPERHPNTTPKPVYVPENPDKETPTSKIPDTCDTSYDSVAVIGREVFIFKDAYFWRIGEKGLLPGYPAEITRLWKALPENLIRVNSVYERPDGKIVFFIGKKYYVFAGNKMDYGYPKPLTDLGLSEDVEKIDGAMVWGHNGKTYFFSSNIYWKFDEDTNKVELDYPRDMSMWKGVGNDIDAVFQWKDGKTYFFKGKGFWKFNDMYMRVEHKDQKASAPFWMGCTDNMQGRNVGQKLPYKEYVSHSCNFNPSILVLILCLIVSQIFKII